MRGTKEDPFIIEHVDDVDELLATPGYYQTTSTFPAYSVVKALSGWHPLVKDGSELPFVEGNVFFFEVLSEPESDEMRPNALVAMGVSPDFWTKMLQRYTNWELAWWREVVQNARDAGATQIDLDIKEGVYKDIETGAEISAMVVSAYDNGTGMSADVLRRALLTRGGSVKPESAVGGFGDAKNLILFPWYGWKVETNDLVAEGQHESVQDPPGVHRVSPGIKGTKITVWMPMDKTTASDYALQLIERSYLRDVKIRINGKPVKADLIGGEEIARASINDSATGQIAGDLIAHHQPRSRTRSGVFIRARGVYMFDESMFNYEDKSSTSKIPGVVYIDIDVPARMAFDASRNSLVGAPRQFVSNLLKSLVKEPEAVLRSKKHKMERVYRGTGSIETRQGVAAEIAAKSAAKIQDQLQRRLDQKKEPDKKMTDDLADAVGDALEEQKRAAPPPSTPEEEVAKNLGSSRDTATELINATVPRSLNQDQVVATTRMAAWQPDFFITANIPFWKTPASVLPEKMSKKYLAQLRLWTELCKFALVQLGHFEPFGVGFVFLLDGIHGEPFSGAYKRHDAQDWLLMNPLTFKRKDYDYDAGAYHYDSEGDRFDLSVTSDLEDFCSLVVHEVTHLQGFADHDQAYANALTSNMKVAHRGLIGLAHRLVPIIRAEIEGKAAKRTASVDEGDLSFEKPSKRAKAAPARPRLFDPFEGATLNNETFFRQFAMLVTAARFPSPRSPMISVDEKELEDAARDLANNFLFKYRATGEVGAALRYAFAYYSSDKILFPASAGRPAALAQATAGRKAFIAFIAQVQKLAGKDGPRVAQKVEDSMLDLRGQIAEMIESAYEPV